MRTPTTDYLTVSQKDALQALRSFADALDFLTASERATFIRHNRRAKLLHDTATRIFGRQLPLL